MSFRFKRKEKIVQAVPRLVDGRVRKSAGYWTERETLDAVHCVRKEIKKLRALSRLVRAGMERQTYRRVTKHWRAAAGRLSSARDAHVTLKALDSLIDCFRDQLKPHPFAPLRSALRRICEQESKRLDERRASQRVAAGLKRTAKMLDRIRLRRNGWAALAAGLQQSYRRGRKAHRLACASPTPENLHEWRKRVKDLWYQLRLLRRIWPQELKAMTEELKALSGCLGDCHDLVLLKRSINHLAPASGSKKQGEVLCGLLEQRQHELRDQALAVGARFYIDAPSDFCERLHSYWNLWRHGK